MNHPSIKEMMREYRYKEALRSIEKKYKIKKSPSLLFTKAVCLYFLSRADEAVLILENLYKHYPRRARYGQLLARCLTIVGRYNEAFNIIRRLPTRVRLVLPLLGWHLIANGQFCKGLKTMAAENKQGWRAEYVYNLPKEKKLLNGVSIKNKRIFIAEEAGIGDQILFARFIEEYKRRGAYVIFGANPQLHSLFSRLPIPPDELRTAETVLSSEYDYWTSTGVDTTILTLGCNDTCLDLTIPYLNGDPAYIKKWKQYLSKDKQKPKIALRYESKENEVPNQFRSIQPHVLPKFARLGQLFSFQRDGDKQKLLQYKDIVDLSPRLKTWEDTAAALSCMDYVVTSCTSIAHLAGAMGKKTLILTHMFPYFLWALPSQKTYWYPSVRIFRQPHYLDWEGSALEAYKWISEDIKMNSK